MSCGDGTLYTGITTDLDRRLKEHNSGGAASAKYTRGRGPITLAYSKRYKDRSSASIAEATLKKLSKEEKMELIAVEALLA